MTDTNYLRDALKDAPKGRWTAARCAAPSSTAPTRKRTTAVTGSCQRQRVGGDHLLPVANGLLQGLLRRSGHWASRSQGDGHRSHPGAGSTQAFTEAVVNVDSH